MVRFLVSSSIQFVDRIFAYRGCILTPTASDRASFTAGEPQYFHLYAETPAPFDTLDHATNIRIYFMHTSLCCPLQVLSQHISRNIIYHIHIASPPYPEIDRFVLHSSQSPESRRFLGRTRPNTCGFDIFKFRRLESRTVAEISGNEISTF